MLRYIGYMYRYPFDWQSARHQDYRAPPIQIYPIPRLVTEHNLDLTAIGIKLGLG